MNVTNSDKLRKNAIAFEGMVITSNRIFFEKLGYVPGQEPSDKVKEFFDQPYEFAKQEIGFKGTDKNILSAVVHYDSKGKLMWNTVTDSEQRKLSRDSFWKNKGGNTSYTQMQDRFYEQISINYGLERKSKV